MKNAAGGGISADFTGELTVGDGSIEAVGNPAVRVSSSNISASFSEIKATNFISATIDLSNTKGNLLVNRLTSESNSSAPAVRLQNHSGIFRVDRPTIKSSGGDGIVIRNTYGSVNITRADIEAAGGGIIVRQEPEPGRSDTGTVRGAGTDETADAEPETKLILQSSKVQASTGFAVDVRSSDPRELTVAIENDTLAGKEGEIALIEEEGGTITLANFAGGDAAAVVAFLQEVNEGAPRVTVEGDIGPGVDITAVEPIGDGLPARLRLEQNVPNPFRPDAGGTVIEFAISQAGYTELAVYNLFGQRVAVLHSGSLAAGSYSVGWDGGATTVHPVSSGVYVYRLTVGSAERTRTMLLVK